MEYRNDITGLRCIAVVLVFLYHATDSILTGGYLGVDVFFVISGYMMMRVLHLNSGATKIKSFYAQRISRVFPIILVVCCTISIYSYLFFIPPDFQSVLKYSLSALSFSTNFYSWTQVGYFNPGADYYPLIHLWSLAVEMQYWIVAPLFYFLIISSNKKLYSIFLITFILSLSLHVWATLEAPSAGFYFSVTRF